MENQFNKALPIENDALQTDLNLTNPQQDVEGFSGSTQEPKNISNDKEKPKPTSSPKPDPLANIGKFVKGQREGGKETLFEIDYDKYAPYFGGNVGYYTPASVSSLDRQRANEQGNLEQFKNALTRISLNVLPEVVSQLSNIVDIEDYNNSNAEIGNWMSNYMKTIQQDVDEANPIYRENPDKPLDVTDGAWWFENGANLVTSAAGFVATGYIAGGLTAGAVNKVGQGMKWAKSLGQFSQLSAGEQQLARGASTLINAYTLNQAEGIGIGVDTFKEVYEKQLQNLKADEGNIDKDITELEKIARERAANAASSAVAFNRVNTLLNITSASLFMKTPMSTRSLLSKPNWKKSLGVIGLEGGQEYVEELVNDFSQQQAQDSKYNFTKAIDHAMSAEGVESGLLGFMGGAGQTALTKAGKYVPMQMNKTYNQAYTEAYQAQDENIPAEERDAKAIQKAIEVAGRPGLVSQNSINKRRYAQQQEGILNHNNLSTSDKIGELTNTFYSAEENTELLNNINKAEEKGDIATADTLRNTLFTNQAYNAFQLGTTESLLGVYEGFAELSKEEAEAKGLIVEEGKDNYKVKANEAIKQIKDLESIYEQTRGYLNSDHVYSLEEKKYGLTNKMNIIKSEFDTILSKTEEDYKKRGKSISKSGAYRDSDKLLGYDKTKVNPAFKRSKSYTELNKLVDLYDTTAKSVDTLQTSIDKVTSKDFQSELKDIISENKKKRTKEERKQILTEATQVGKTKVNGIISSLRDTVQKKEAEVENTTPEVIPPIVVGTQKQEEVQEVVSAPSFTNPVKPIKGTKPKKPILLDFPYTTNSTINQVISNIKNDLEDPSRTLEYIVDTATKTLQTLIDNKEGFKLNFPLEAKVIDGMQDAVFNALEEAKKQLSTNNTVNTTLNSKIQDFVTDLEEDNVPSPDEVVEDESPAVNTDRSKTIERVQKLIDLLDEMESTGIDISSFKDTILAVENAVGKERVLGIFNQLKALYNLANNANVEGTYEELILDIEEQQDILSKVDRVVSYNKKQDKYDAELDDISDEMLQQFQDIFNMEKIDGEVKAITSEVYNEIGSNKLAYLARLYKSVFTPKISATGLPYIEVSKQDINDLLNSMADQRIFNPEFLKAGTNVTFVPLTSVTLEDGTILDAKDTTPDTAPIGIEVDGELLEGIYLHSVEWLNTNNLDNSKEGIEADQAKLRALRNYILTSKVPVSTSVIERTPGVPILNSTNTLNSVLDVMPNVEIGISRAGKIYTSRNTTAIIANKNSIKEGRGVVLVPYGNKKLALPVRRQQLRSEEVDSIISAYNMYLDGKQTESTKQLKEVYGLDILTSKGIEEYFNMFINLDIYPVKSFNGFKQLLGDISDNIAVIQFAGGKLYFGYGMDINSNHIYKDKSTIEERQKDLLMLRQFLRGQYNHVNLDLLKGDKKIPYILDNGEVYNKYDNYSDYAKSSMLTPYLSMKLEDGTEIYTIQGKIKFDLESAYGITEVSETIEKDNINEEVNTKITLPNGNTFDINDVTEDDLSPSLEQENKDINKDELLKSVSLIEGLSIETQSSLYKSIANDIYLEIKNTENQQANIRSQINLAFEGFDMIASTYVEANHLKAQLVVDAINIIKANKPKVIAGVEKELRKKTAITKDDIYETREELGLDKDNETSEISEERSLFLDTLQYTIDPRTSLTSEVKDFLESVTEKVKDKKGNYINKTNLLGLKIYVPFDVVFNDLMKILSKTNTNLRFISDNIINTDKYGNNPDYVVDVLIAIEKEIENKPYLVDVYNKLKDAKLHTQNAFISTLNKTHTNHNFVQAIYNKDTKSYSIRTTKSASRNVANLVLSEWNNNLKQSKIVVNNNDVITLNNNVLKDFNTIYKNIVEGKEIPNKELLTEWLGLIGVDLDEKVFNLLNLKGIKINGVRADLMSNFTMSNGIFKNIYNRVNKFNPKFEGSLDLETEHLYEDKAFKTLAQLTTNYRVNLFTDSFKNGNGDTIYGYSNSRYAIDRLLELKANPDLLQELKQDPFIANSKWLNELLIEDENGIRINTDSVFYNSFEYATSDSLKLKQGELGDTIDQLTEGELEKYHLGLFFNNGKSVGKDINKIPIMKVLYNTMEEKANTFIIQVPRTNYILEANRLSDKQKEELVDIFITPELERISAYQFNPNKVNSNAYRKGAGMFLMFPALNDEMDLWTVDENGNKLLRDYKDLVSDSKVKEILKKAITNYVSSEVLNKLETWKKHGIVNTYNNVDVFSFIDGNFKNQFNGENVREVAANFVINTMIANMNIQQLFIGDPANYYKPAKGDVSGIDKAIHTFENIGKRLSGDNAGKTQYTHTKGETFKVLVVGDNKEIASNYEYIKSAFNNRGSLYINSDDYVDIESTDAQEYTTLEEHINLLVGEGTITKEVKDEVIKIYKQTGKISEEFKDLVLNPTKPVYVNNVNREGINSRVYIKSSSFPLIKEFTENTPLDVLREFMENNNINRVAHSSAVKVGSPAKIINIYNNDGSITIPEDWKASELELPRQGHGKQQEVPYDSTKDKANDGTQQAKLLFTNLLDINGFINPFTGEKVNGRELANEYIQRYASLFKGKYQKLVQDLEYDAKSNTIGNLNKLRNILREEGLSRNYSINDLESFNLNELGTKFSNELWLSNVDSKVVALLNSIVDNRIRKRKFKGKSFVLGAPSGVKLDVLKPSIISQVIPVGDWDGTLKGSINKNGVMTYAEVLIPFKFWDNEGNLLKVTDFITDGILDLNRLPQDALEIFGYRIPTSGINLISTIKVVGFLPSSMGDIVFAPKEFIVQMGSDFDVDKLYTHMYNTHYNSLTKSIEVINRDLVGRYNRVKDNVKVLQDRVNILTKNGIKSATDNAIVNELNEQINFLSGVDLNKLKDIDELLIQNDLVDIHKAVLNNPAKEVQYARNRKLSFGLLPELAKQVQAKKDNKWFTAMKQSYQVDKYLSARASKTAVGVFSLDTVFNSVLQYVNTPLYLTNSTLIDGAIQTKPSIFNIAGQRSNNLNDAQSIQGRYKSEVFEAFMQAALDNGKEQLLGKLNINNGTFDTIRVLAQLGYQEDVIIGIINQPIIKAYLFAKETNDASFKIPENKKEYKDIIANLSVEELLESAKTTNIKSEMQNAVLNLFLELDGKGKELKVVQSTINSDSSGIGKNLFYSVEKAIQIKNLNTTTSIPNIEQVIGDYKVPQSVEEANILLTDGYIRTDNVYIKPNSIGGFAAMYATTFNNQLWSSLYPYTQDVFNNIIDTSIIGKRQKGSSISAKADSKQNAVSAYKSLLISNQYQLFSNYNSVYEAREELLYDTNTKQSLGTFIQNLKSTGKYSNALLDRLQIGRGNSEINANGKIPTDINYYNAISLDMDEEVVINSIVDMIVNIKEIGTYNGNNITSADLFDLLLTHQLITGGLQKSGQFLKYVPHNYLEQKGYYKALSKLNDDITNSENSKEIAKILRTQNIQHNPAEYYDAEVEKGILKIEGNIAYVTPEIKKISNGFVIRKVDDTNYRVFKYDSSISQFKEIDLLGWKGITEYDITSTFAGKSTMYINQRSPKELVEIDKVMNSVTTEVIPNQADITNFLNIDRDTTSDSSPLIYNTDSISLSKKYYLDDETISIEDKYRLILNKIVERNDNPIMTHFAKEISNVVSYLSDVPLYVDYKLKAQAVTRSTRILGQPLQIRINPNKINSEEELQEVLVEEMTHAILKSELNNGSLESTKLNNIFKEVKDIAIKKYGQDTYNEVERKLKQGLPLKEGVERNILYNLINVDEFVAASIKDKTFQKFLSSTEATTSTKSLWDKFVNIFKNILIKLGVKQNSNLEAVLHEVLNKFDNVNKSLYKELTVPKYVRSPDYLNKRFNLVDNQASAIIKGNPKEIADFINSNIVNVKAIVDNNYVKIESNVFKDIIQDFAPEIEMIEHQTVSENFVNYIKTLDIRINQATAAVKKAKSNKDFTKSAELSEILRKLKEDRSTIKEVKSLAHLSVKANEDLAMIDTMLNRPMSAEDLIFARNIVGFWKDAKTMVFDERAYTSTPLLELYAQIEGKARLAHIELSKIEKNYLMSVMKEQLGKDVNIDELFEKYKDINTIQANFRDISTYDNKLLDSIWISIKKANIEAIEEGETILSGFDKLLENVLPILKSLNTNTRDAFEIFRQKTKNGKYTNRLVSPFSHEFYKAKNKVLTALYSDNNKPNLDSYINWVQVNGVNTNINLVFPIDGVITKEVELARIELKNKVGEGTYNYWFKAQEKRIARYNESREGYLNNLLKNNNLNSLEDLQKDSKLANDYLFYIERNSPYHLEKIINRKAKSLNITNFNNFKYYEVIPSNLAYLDTNYKVIENNATLLEFYDKVEDIFEELNRYVPEGQQKALSYGGIPSIEKSLFEMFSEKRLALGFKPVYDTFIKSMQTSYTSNAVSEIDPVTKKPVRNMRVDLIKDNYAEIQDYVNKKSAEYVIANKKEPGKGIVEAFKEEIIDIIAREHSFDLGKIVKVYSALVLAHKHKAKLEDMTKIAETVIDEYTEVLTRPDGSPITAAGTGVVQRKDKSQSFLNMKGALNSSISNIFYGDVKEEQLKGNKILTATEKQQKVELINMLADLEKQFENELISAPLYNATRISLEAQLDNLGKAIVGSKVGDNILKYVQLKLMGWNALGGVSNMGFGYLSNLIESAGGQLYSASDLNYAYRLVASSVVKNATFNKVEIGQAKKIRSFMDKWDIMKDASNELNNDTTRGSLGKNVEFLSPYNINQRTEYINQAPLLVALARATKVETPKGTISIWEGFDENLNWNTEYGEEPKQVIQSLRIKLDQLIKRNHGNYDPLSPLKVKRTLIGRAGSQFRTWMYESIAVRFEKEREDEALGIVVKGRYNSVWSSFGNTESKVKLLGQSLITLLKQYSFGFVKYGNDFNSFVDGEGIKEVDAANMRKVVKEISLAINTYMFLLLLSAIAGDDDDDKNRTMNILFNQGTRLKTDLLLYVNPMEARNVVRDIIPATMLVKDLSDWVGAVGTAVVGEDTIENGVHKGDSRLGSSTLKQIPLGSKIYSTYNSWSQIFDK